MMMMTTKMMMIVMMKIVMMMMMMMVMMMTREMTLKMLETELMSAALPAAVFTLYTILSLSKGPTLPQCFEVGNLNKSQKPEEIEDFQI